MLLVSIVSLFAALPGAEDPPTPRPVADFVSVSGPMVVEISFHKNPIEKAWVKAIEADFAAKSIPYYEPGWAGDDAVPRGEPIGRLRITGARVFDEGRVLLLATDPHPRRAVYVLDWLETKQPSQARYVYSGVETSWHYGADDPPLRSTPTGGFIQAKDLTIDKRHGGLEIARRGDPSKYVRWTSLLVPKGKQTLVLSGNLPFTAFAGNTEIKATEPKSGTYRSEAELESTGDPIELTIVLNTALIGKGWEFSAGWKRDGKEIPITAAELAFPWMLPEKPVTSAPKPPFDLTGGDPIKGEAVFRSEEAKCATCHSARGKGGAVGPSLDGQKGKELSEIFYNIAEPSARIDPEYRTYTVARKDGQVAVGVVRGEGFDSIRVLDINGKPTIFPKTEIEDMTASATSTMPVGLAGAIGEAKMRDLLAFLRGTSP